MSGPEVSGVVKRLCGLSVARHAAAQTLFTWPAAPPRDQLAMTQRLVSLAGLPEYLQLTDEGRWTLHLAEVTHFFALNLHGEQELIAGAARRMDHRDPDVAAYLLHFIEEEACHSQVFARFCRQYAPASPSVALPPASPDARADVDAFLFYARVLVFEEVADGFNRAIAADADVWPLVRDINDYHATDEARHLAFGRVMVERAWERLRARGSAEALAPLRAYVKEYLEVTWRSYTSPAAYRHVGLVERALELRERALASEGRRALREEVTRRLETWLRRVEILDDPIPA